MANLDSRSKRASSVQMLVPAILTPVLPDGTINQGDRQHTAHMYSGILAGAAVAVVSYEERARLGYHEAFGVSGGAILGGR